MTYISSQSLSSTLRLSILQAQSSLSQAQQEVSSQAPADLGLTLGARTGTSLSLKVEIDRLNTFSSMNSVAATRLSTTQTTLTAMLASAKSMSSALITASSSGGTTDSLQSAAKVSLQSLIAGLNTSVGGQFVFGGIKTDTQPVADYFSSTSSAAKTSVDSAFQTTFGTSQTSAGASTISGADMNAFLDGPFANLFSDASWGSDWSSASSTTQQTTISPSQSLTTSVSANDTAFRQIAQAYTMLSEFTGATMSDAARAAVVSKASSLVSTAIASLTNTQSAVGVAQSAISDSKDTMSAQVLVLKANVSDLESVDTYDLSAKITSLQTQLEASYQLTSRLQQLSLTNYLTG